MAAKVNITRFRGDTDPLVFILTKDKLPLDLTGSTFTLSVSTISDPLTADYVVQLNGVSSLPLTGKVSFTPTDVQMDIVGDYFYDVEMVSGTSKKTIVTGKLKMVQDITK
jgi:hypothetical protein